MSSGKPKDGDLQIVPVTKAADHPRPPAVPPLPLKVSAAAAGSSALVEYKAPVFKEEEEDLELKLRRILENVPVRVSNTSGSSAGAGSGDFHQHYQFMMIMEQVDACAYKKLDSKSIICLVPHVTANHTTHTGKCGEKSKTGSPEWTSTTREGKKLQSST
ncbi:hypothetical protein LINPERHAP2_LOCUS41571 [Linum perenne]